MSLSSPLRRLRVSRYPTQKAAAPDSFACLEDEVLLRILSLLPQQPSRWVERRCRQGRQQDCGWAGSWAGM
jgi:hypothetical protein